MKTTRNLILLAAGAAAGHAITSILARARSHKMGTDRTRTTPPVSATCQSAAPTVPLASTIARIRESMEAAIRRMVPTSPVAGTSAPENPPRSHSGSPATRHAAPEYPTGRCPSPACALQGLLERALSAQVHIDTADLFQTPASELRRGSDPRPPRPEASAECPWCFATHSQPLASSQDNPCADSHLFNPR